MAITYETKMEDGLLIVTSSGRDKDVQDVIDYGSAIIDAAVASGASLILCDERNLEYALSTSDTYQAAQTIASRARRVVRVAIVCGPKFLEDGKFWETVAVNRALQVRVDTDMARARQWLVKDAK